MYRMFFIKDGEIGFICEIEKLKDMYRQFDWNQRYLNRFFHEFEANEIEMFVVKCDEKGECCLSDERIFEMRCKK